MALPSLTRTIDDDFVNTWYEIRADVIDNILDATPLWMALKEHGCMQTQVGGEYITRTVGYGEKSMQRIQKGSVLSQSETPLDTMARWDWRHFAVDINRSVVDDQKNAGPSKIKDYISRRLEAARNAIVQDFERDLYRWQQFQASPRQVNGLLDINAPTTAVSSMGGTSTSDTNSPDQDGSENGSTTNGNIARAGNAWWRNWGFEASATYNQTNKVGATNAPISLNLVPDMRTMFNAISDNMESPNFIITDRASFELYEDEVSDKQQIVRTSFDQRAADLGFETLTFKGATITWSPHMTVRTMHMLNLNHVEFVYDPNLWFDMTNWKETTNQLERVAYIVCATPGLITAQPRRHGYGVWAS